MNPKTTLLLVIIGLLLIMAMDSVILRRIYCKLFGHNPEYIEANPMSESFYHCKRCSQYLGKEL